MKNCDDSELLAVIKTLHSLWKRFLVQENLKTLGEVGHDIDDLLTDTVNKNASVKVPKVVCSICRRPGHMRLYCPDQLSFGDIE